MFILIGNDIRTSVFPMKNCISVLILGMIEKRLREASVLMFG